MLMTTEYRFVFSMLTVCHFSVTQESYVNNENGVSREGDSTGGPYLVKPLSNTSCNRPFRLGLSRKHGNKPLHPYFKKKQ